MWSTILRILLREREREREREIPLICHLKLALLTREGTSLLSFLFFLSNKFESIVFIQ